MIREEVNSILQEVPPTNCWAEASGGLDEVRNTEGKVLKSTQSARITGEMESLECKDGSITKL